MQLIVGFTLLTVRGVEASKAVGTAGEAGVFVEMEACLAWKMGIFLDFLSRIESHFLLISEFCSDCVAGFGLRLPRNAGSLQEYPQKADLDPQTPHLL